MPGGAPPPPGGALARGRAPRPQPKAPPLPPAVGARKLALYARAAGGAAAAASAAAAAGACLLRSAPLWQLAAAWLALELAFAFFYRGHLERLSRPPAEHRPADHDGAATARRFYSLREYFAFSEYYLRYWFKCADMKHIKRENVLDLLSYGFWYRTKEDLAARGELEFLDGMLTKLEEETGIDLEPGSTPGLPFMSHLHDDLPAVFRPLAFYAFTEFLGLVTQAMLWATGFERHNVCGMVYYTLKAAPPAGASGPASVNDARGGAYGDGTPVIMMHGVAAGVLPYLDLLFTLAATGRPLVIPEYRHVSMRLTTNIPNIEQLVASAASFLQLMGYEKAHVIGHSYGSFVASRMQQLHPKAVATLTLLDPVCFAIFMPTLLYTFLYSFPASGNILIDTGMYLVSRELHMTATFCRQFYWSDYNLWPEYVPRHMLAVLGGKDRLCQAHDIKVWLDEQTDARVMYDPKAVHAEMLMRPSYVMEIMAQWADMAAAQEAEAAAGRAAAAAAAPLLIKAAAAAAAEEEVGASEVAPAGAAEAEGDGMVIRAEPSPAVAHAHSHAHAHAHGHATLRARRRPNPFQTGSENAHVAAGGGVSAAKAAAGGHGHAHAHVHGHGHGHAHEPQASGPQVEALVRQLRQQQERVRAQEEANIAAARQLLAIAQAVRRSQTAPPAGPPAGGAFGAPVADDGASSDVSSNLDGDLSLGSDDLSDALAPRGAPLPSPGRIARRLSGSAAGSWAGGGDVAVLGGGRVYSPLLAFASAAYAAEARGGGAGGAHAAAPRRPRGHSGAGALQGAASGALGSVAGKFGGLPTGKGLADSASIDLGALAYGGGAFAPFGGAAAAAQARRQAAALAGDMRLGAAW